MRDKLSLTGAFPALRVAEPLSSNSLWRSLAFFNLYRLILAGILLLVPTLFGEIFQPGGGEQGRFWWGAVVYTALVLASQLAINFRMPRATLQLAFQVGSDIACIAVLMHFSGGIQGNLGMLLLVSLALAGMIARGRITLLFAALATIAIMLEHGYAVLVSEVSPSLFFQVGILSAAYFAISWLAHTLSRYAQASEKLATVRGVDLSNMAEANRLMIQGMPDGVLVVDEYGKIRQSNPSAARLLGIPLPSGGYARLEECSSVVSAMFAAWRQNRALTNEILQLPGTRHPVRVRFLPVQRGAFWGAVIVLEDMQRIQEQAQQVKLAALGRLTANIAHEVRNPLSSISYAAELLKERAESAEQGRLLQIILDNASRLNRIVQDVMQVNRRDRANPEVFHLRAVLEESVMDMCRVEQIGREVFALQIPADLQVEFDRGHFEQVVWNLSRNALRHSRKNTASVSMRAQILPGERARLEVADDGPGVPAGMVQKLFEPFFTTDSKGTGLGLYIARELCEANGATLEYHPAAQGGAEFHVVMKGVA